VESFNLRKLNETEFRKYYQIESSNRFVALENLSNPEEVNIVWENIKHNIQTSTKDTTGLCELKQ
jgi:hypothetical protein